MSQRLTPRECELLARDYKQQKEAVSQRLTRQKDCAYVVRASRSHLRIPASWGVPCGFGQRSGADRIRPILSPEEGFLDGGHVGGFTVEA